MPDFIIEAKVFGETAKFWWDGDLRTDNPEALRHLKIMARMHIPKIVMPDLPDYTDDFTVGPFAYNAIINELKDYRIIKDAPPNYYQSIWKDEEQDGVTYIY